MLATLGRKVQAPVILALNMVMVTSSLMRRMRKCLVDGADGNEEEEKVLG